MSFYLIIKIIELLTDHFYCNKVFRTLAFIMGLQENILELLL